MNLQSVNVSGNDSYVTNDGGTYYESASAYVRMIGHPLIATLGLLGNTLSICVFLTRGMRSLPSSIFLAALAVADNLFLLSLLTSWIDEFFYNILSSTVVCATFVFITYTAAFLSVWFIVGFTYERFIAICFPLRRNLLCSVFREKSAVVVLSVLAVVFYSFSFWTIETHSSYGYVHCVPKLEFMDMLHGLTWLDTLLTGMLPFVIISSMNAKIIHTMIYIFPMKSANQGQPLAGQPTNGFKNASCIRGRLIRRVTRLMLLVSTTFLVLNLPSHIARLYSLIASVSSDNPYVRVSSELKFLQELAQLLYYLTFGCNFFLYTLYGRNFKRALLEMVQCSPTSGQSNDVVLRSSRRDDTSIKQRHCEGGTSV